jgi:hypothetical protein
MVISLITNVNIKPKELLLPCGLTFATVFPQKKPLIFFLSAREGR